MTRHSSSKSESDLGSRNEQSWASRASEKNEQVPLSCPQAAPPRRGGAIAAWSHGPSGILYTWTGSGKSVQPGTYWYIPVHDRTSWWQYENSTFTRDSTYWYELQVEKRNVVFWPNQKETREINSSRYSSYACHGETIWRSQSFSKLLKFRLFQVHTSTYMYVQVQTSTNQHTSFDHAPSALRRLWVSAECLAWSSLTVFFLIEV